MRALAATAQLTGKRRERRHRDDNIWGYLWAKSLWRHALRDARGQRFDRGRLALPQYFGLWKALGSEVMAVAAAEKARPMGFNGFEPPPSPWEPSARRPALDRRDGRAQPQIREVA